jgi:hypothetical protein
MIGAVEVVFDRIDEDLVLPRFRPSRDLAGAGRRPRSPCRERTTLTISAQTLGERFAPVHVGLAKG